MAGIERLTAHGGGGVISVPAFVGIERHGETDRRQNPPQPDRTHQPEKDQNGAEHEAGCRFHSVAQSPFGRILYSEKKLPAWLRCMNEGTSA